MTRILFLYIILFISQPILLAQSRYFAHIDSVSENGYYNIELSQPIIALSAINDFANIRIKDRDGKEVPYFVRPESPIREINQFVNYQYDEKIVGDSTNLIILNNEKLEELSRLYIVMAEADVRKYVRIRGSNDKKQWFIVKQQDEVTHRSYKENNDEILILDFPTGNYKYYEIALTNNAKTPLNIRKVGNSVNSNIYGQFTEINTSKFVQKDSTDKNTYIYFPELKYKYCIYKLSFKIKDAMNFMRIVYLDDNNFQFEISSRKDNTFYLDAAPLSSKEAIIVENRDNPPLQFESIKIYGLNRYVCAYLEKGKHYDVEVHEGNMPKANYDIENFQNDIPQNLSILKLSDLKENQIAERELLWIEKPIFMWSIIILVGVLLTLLCIKMIKDIKKRK